MNSLLDRFCRYVKIETTAREDSTTYPSTACQLNLSRLLLEELQQIGLADAEMSEHGIVTATIPATVNHTAPVIAWFAHVDTSPEYTAKNVKPQVIRDYDGKDIVLPGDSTKVIQVSKTPELKKVVGKTLVTTDGTTLLGADDKSGVAIIMETAQRLTADKSIKHGPIRVCFTCDEEIGHGVDHVDLKKLGATVGYTLDGESEGAIDVGTFSANLATVTVQGVNTHPANGKGRMINSIRIASTFIAKMPWKEMSPETTEGDEGFLHPYVLEGGVERTKIKILLRDFITGNLSQQADLLHDIANHLMSRHAGCKIDVQVTEQYRNMAEGLAKEPRAVSLAEKAMQAAGLEPRRETVRGGTDGSRLTALGLPTPNLSAGMHNFHSPLEWACLDQMESAVKVLIELAKLWGNERA